VCSVLCELCLSVLALGYCRSWDAAGGKAAPPVTTEHFFEFYRNTGIILGIL
jgi:hypothetical protein